MNSIGLESYTRETQLKKDLGNCRTLKLSASVFEIFQEVKHTLTRAAASKCMQRCAKFGNGPKFTKN